MLIQTSLPEHSSIIDFVVNSPFAIIIQENEPVNRFMQQGLGGCRHSIDRSSIVNVPELIGTTNIG